MDYQDDGVLRDLQDPLESLVSLERMASPEALVSPVQRVPQDLKGARENEGQLGLQVNQDPQGPPV